MVVSIVKAKADPIYVKVLLAADEKNACKNMIPYVNNNVESNLKGITLQTRRA